MPVVLIYINDLSENIKSTVKLSVDDPSMFDVVKDPNTSAEILNHDLTRIAEWDTDKKYLLIRTHRNKLRKSCFLIKLRKQIIKILQHLGLILDELLMTILHLDFPL